MDYSTIYQEKFNTLLLDRDGTINVHIIGGYVCKKDDFEFVPGFLEEMPKMAAKFKYIFIVTKRYVYPIIVQNINIKKILPNFSIRKDFFCSYKYELT